MDNYNYDWNNFRPLILCITFLGCFATGVAGFLTAVEGFDKGTTIEGSLGLIASAFAFSSVLFFLKKKQ